MLSVSLLSISLLSVSLPVSTTGEVSVSLDVCASAAPVTIIAKTSKEAANMRRRRVSLWNVTTGNILPGADDVDFTDVTSRLQSRKDRFPVKPAAAGILFRFGSARIAATQPSLAATTALRAPVDLRNGLIFSPDAVLPCHLHQTRLCHAACHPAGGIC